MDDLAILFCRPEPGSTMEDAFELEADTVDALDLESFVISADLVVDGEPERAMRKVSRDAGRLLFRGPILTAEEYEALYEAAAERGAELVVDPVAYEHALYVPEHHDAIADLAAPARWTYGEDLDEAWEAARELGDPPWLLKDHVKSVKEQWEDACFVPGGATKQEFMRIAETMVELRGERFARGIVIRKFLELAPSSVRTAERRIPDEHRLFFWEGKLICHAPYHDVGDPLDDVSQFSLLGRRIASPFFTADVAFLRDGGWIVVEINDGGVSSLPEQLDPRALYRAIAGR
ncbi:MAG: ATP-grasp domain-containing protein [Sandaracinaceae bacterium]|nr:ATP-grasp domain-containing protein [Sandaracinaceae bacterium]